MNTLESITKIEAGAYKILTDQPESDGTFAWDHTILVTVHVYTQQNTGFGYTYAERAVVPLVNDVLAPRLLGGDPAATASHWDAMHHAVRNLGDTGLCCMAIAAVDNALWDLKAKVLGVPLVHLLGGEKESIPVYGSGGFTSYTEGELTEQMANWAAEGFRFVKMKIGQKRTVERKRVHAARRAVGPEVELFVDANGAYTPKEALFIAQTLSDENVTWFEEPVPHADHNGLRFVRERLPAPIQTASGEYGFTIRDFKTILEHGCVDVLQADATRCGTTGFMQASTLCDAYRIPLSAHTAPSIHMHLCCAAAPSIHLEYFYDHVRIEKMLFDGYREPDGGELTPDINRPGMGIIFKKKDAERFKLV